MDFADSPGEREFRLRLRAWLRTNTPKLPPSSTSDEYWAARYPLPVALLLGSEGEGLPAALLARGDLAVRIPMVGTAHSLNLAVAAGILLYEVRRQVLARDAGGA